MKILMVNKFLYHNGGSETYMFRLGEELKRHGHEVEYFGMEHEGRCVENSTGAYTKNMDFHNGSFISKLSYPVRTIYSIEARKKISLILDDFKPDVCHLNNFNYQLTPSIILEIVKWREKTGHKCRIVYTAHDYQLICPNHMLNNPNTHKNCEKCLEGHFFYCTRGRCIHGSYLKSLSGTMEAFFWKRVGVYRYIDTVICPSRFVKDKLGSDPLLSDKTVVIHNFVDTEFSDKENVCIASDLPEMPGYRSGRYVLYFGRYSEEKGVSVLAEVCRDLPDIPFVFAGKGELSFVLEGIPNIYDAGFLSGDKLWGIVRNARFVVMPSGLHESFGLSAAEAISLGTPVIASAVGGLKEIMEESGAGIAYESGSKEGLREAIRALWEGDSMLERFKMRCRDYRFMDPGSYYERLMTGIYA